MGRLDRYVLRRFLGWYGVSLLYLVGLFMLVDVVSRLDHFLEARENLEALGTSVAAAMLRFYAAGLPLIVQQVAPFVTVMGASLAVVDLRRTNEIYPMMEAGRSPLRILAPVIAFSLVLTGVLVVTQDQLVPAAVEQRLRVERAMEGREERATAKVPHVRDAAGNVWNLTRYDHHERIAYEVRVSPWTTDEGSWDLLLVDRMQWNARAGGWVPENGRCLAVGGASLGAGAVDVLPGDAPLRTSLRPEEIDLVRASEDLQGLSGRRLAALRKRHPQLSYLAVLAHRRWTHPLANLVLLLVGLPLVLRGRGSSLFWSVLASLGVCAAYFVADTLLTDFAGRGLLPPAVAAWSATILFGAAGITLMDATRAG